MALIKCPTCGKLKPTSYHIMKCENDALKKKLSGKTDDPADPTIETETTEDPETPDTEDSIDKVNLSGESDKNKKDIEEEEINFICGSCQKKLQGRVSFCPYCGCEF